uniref:Uncharacterized protein n=1 Tax=Cacopsylla melanoneura TaxID=428564 RepID=A0A8D8ZAD7_9HEMI
MQEIINFLQVLTNTVSEIEISFSFCKARVLHPSIIPKKDLDVSLLSLRTSFLTERIPPIQSNYYATLGTSSCLIHEYNILFGVEIPLFSPFEYQYSYLAPVPIHSQNKYGLITTDVKYALQRDETILGLPSKCTPLADKFYCKHSFSPVYLDCLTNILIHKNTSRCKIIPIEKQNFLTQLKESEYVLGFLPTKVQANQSCPLKQIEIILQGTFLLKLNECTLTIGNQTLKKLRNHSSKLTIINGDFTFPELESVNPLKIEEITDLDLNKTTQFQVDKFRELERTTFFDNEFILNKYEISGIILITTAVVLFIWYVKKKYANPNPNKI